jgi:hypothetical protein
MSDSKQQEAAGAPEFNRSLLSQRQPKNHPSAVCCRHSLALVLVEIKKGPARAEP